MNSERDKQGMDKDLESAAERSMSDILSDIRSKLLAPPNTIRQNRQKYFHLLRALECLKLISMPEA